MIDCDVLQADGGTRTASVTGAMAAVAQAIAKLRQLGKLTVSPLGPFVAAVSADHVAERGADHAFDRDEGVVCGIAAVEEFGGGEIHADVARRMLVDRVIVMTARPGRIAAAIPIELPRPRDVGMVSTPAYGRYASQIRALIGDANQHTN